MAEPAISIEGVSKRYRLGTGFEPDGLAHRLENAVRAPVRRLLGRGPSQPPAHDDEEFWSLRDISLEVERGEAFGLIGVNGAGKSTLLKLLSRITLPTEGRIVLRGKVGTLLEVGTGFHPELTGRENVFLNGAILGMRRQEIVERFDAIVAFAGIEQFLDTPVKRYSSGMFVRLAFAVAAHLTPDILLVDEVLAVGDAEFQRRCLGKMDDVTKSGRTVVFVSHNLAAVQRLCTRSAWLHEGRLMKAGPTQEVTGAYMKQMGPRQIGGEVDVGDTLARHGTGEARLRRVSLLDDSGESTNQLHMGEPCTVAMTLEVNEPLKDVVIFLAICATDGTRIAATLSLDGGIPPLELQPGVHEVQAGLELTLLPGDYWIEVGIHESDHRALDFVERVLSFSSLNVGYGDVPHYPWSVTYGFIRPHSTWSIMPPVDAHVSPVQTSR